jgi:hypothetical protein
MSYTYSKNPAKNKQKQEELIAEFKVIESNLMESHYTKIRTDKENEWFSDEWKELNKTDNKTLKDFYDFFNVKKSMYRYNIFEIMPDNKRKLLYEKCSSNIEELVYNNYETKKELPKYFVIKRD